MRAKHRILSGRSEVESRKERAKEKDVGNILELEQNWLKDEMVESEENGEPRMTPK